MADLTSRANYTGAYSGLLNNLWLTIAIAGVCLVGYEIEVRIPRRRGWQGSKKRAVTRIWWAAKRAWARSRRRKDGTGSQDGEKGEKSVRDGGSAQMSKLQKERERVGERESWEFGYIYQPKTWGLNPSPPVPKWPLAWTRDVLKIREADMPPIWGLDITLHSRFLRGCFFYTLLQLLIVAPILLPLHILYSPSTVDVTSMIRAGISSLVESSGSRWLWVHSVLVWWVTICWLTTVLWIIWGGIGYRRREVARLRIRLDEERLKKQSGAAQLSNPDQRRVDEMGQMVPGPDDTTGQKVVPSITVEDEMEVRMLDEDEPVGIKQYRTLMVLNIPPDMRDEETLEDYFNHYIHNHRRRILSRARPNQPANVPSRPPSPGLKPSNPLSLFKRAPAPIVEPSTKPQETITDTAVPGTSKERSSSSDGSDPDAELELMEADEMETEVEDVILVRKLGSLISLRDRRVKVLRELELAHVSLARRVLAAVSKHKKFRKSHTSLDSVIAEKDIVNAAGGTSGNQNKLKKMERLERLDKLTAALGHFVDDEDEQKGEGSSTVWEAMHNLPSELLDPYQALTHLSFTSRFRKTNAPLIDYLTTKLAYLTILLDDARAKPMSSYPASSAAFITFRDARTARLALKVLDNHPKRRLACRAQLAPHWSELLWPRLGLSVYKSQFVRGWVVFLGVWAFTLAWIFPVSLLCALTSLTNIAGFLPQLRTWLDSNPNAASAITSLVPVILVALLTIAICPILLVIANKAETIVTRLGIHNSVLERFWKFLMVNGVVFFAIGQSAIEAYLTAFQRNDFDPLPIVASAFPTAAPYFASYILLQVAIQPCFEIFRFGLPAIVYWFGTRWSSIPRQRSSRTEYPTFSHFSQLPYQLLGGAIMHLFMLLNPLVIPFTLIYYATCYIVWKRQFTYVYGRLYENNGRRSCIRILRYSLDALALGQFVLFAFFILNRAKGEAISTGILFFLTLGSKLVLTRAVKQRFDNLNIEEADMLCPPVPREETNDGSVEDTFVDTDEVDTVYHPHTSLRIQGRSAFLRHRLHAYVHKYAYDSAVLSHGHIKPIPFDWLLFGWLDRYFSYSIETNSPSGHHIIASLPDSPPPPSVEDLEAKARSLVSPHHKLVPWEDIPPYWRARGYDDQPAYTEGYDDFLWLPRDPLSMPDLDDTIEMRASLTTSAGGDGRFNGFDPEEETLHEEIGEGWKEVMANSSVSGAPASAPSEDAELSPAVHSELLLHNAINNIIPPSPESIPAEVEIPEHIGSEIETTPLQSVRKGTIKFADGVQSIFRRPRADTTQTSHSEAVSMRTMSHDSAPSIVIPNAMADSPDLMLGEGGQKEMDETFLTPHRDTGSASSRFPGLPSHGATASSSSTQPSSPTTAFHPPKTAPAATGSGSRITFSSQKQADLALGRSPSGRRPVTSHRGSHSSGTGPPIAGSSRLFSPAPPSVGAQSIRSASAFSHQIRDRSSSSLSAAQHALLREVMEEERVASQSAREAELAGLEKERSEVRKEKERAGGRPLPPATPTNGEPRRRGSISSSTAPSGDVNVRRSATTARAGGIGGAGMVALAANRFSAGRTRRQTLNGQHSPLAMGAMTGERERSGSGARSDRDGAEGIPPSPTTMRTVIQAQLEQPRVASGVSGDTSGSSRTGAAGGVGGLSGLGA